MYFGDSSNASSGKLMMVSDGFGEDFEALYPSLSDLPLAGFPFVANDTRDYSLIKDSINKSYYPNQAIV